MEVLDLVIFPKQSPKLFHVAVEREGKNVPFCLGTDDIVFCNLLLLPGTVGLRRFPHYLMSSRRRTPAGS